MTDIVAYRIDHRPSSLLCREHAEDWPGLVPVTSEDLPDGGICTWHDCGVDVLISAAPESVRVDLCEYDRMRPPYRALCGATHPDGHGTCARPVHRDDTTALHHVTADGHGWRITPPAATDKD